MKKKILFALLSFVVLFASVSFSAFLINAKKSPAKDKKIENTIYVKAGKVSFTEKETVNNYRGRVTAFDNISLSAEVAGKIVYSDVRLKSGESFNKGDILVKIYDKDVRASLKSGKSSLLQTISNILPDLQIDYLMEYDKWMQFFKELNPENSLPKLPEINSDKEMVFLASNNVLASYYSLQQQEISLEKYTITAPFDGFFKTVNKEIGAVASTGAELASIVRSDKLEIIVAVFPEDLKHLKTGNKVEITDNYGQVQYAEISRISKFVDESSQTVNIYLVYKTTENSNLLEGEYVDVNLKMKSISGFEIPREALIDEHFVYELKNNKLSKTNIKVEQTADDFVIISGIEESKTIVTESLASKNPSAKYIAR